MGGREIPAVGDVVHYVSHGSAVQADGHQDYPSQCRPAMVTEVYAPVPPALLSGGDMSEGEPQTLALAVFSPVGVMFADCQQDEHDRAGGTWHLREFCVPTPVPAR